MRKISIVVLVIALISLISLSSAALSVKTSNPAINVGSENFTSYDADWFHQPGYVPDWYLFLIFFAGIAIMIAACFIPGFTLMKTFPPLLFGYCAYYINYMTSEGLAVTSDIASTGSGAGATVIGGVQVTHWELVFVEPALSYILWFMAGICLLDAIGVIFLSDWFADRKAKKDAELKQRERNGEI